MVELLHRLDVVDGERTVVIVGIVGDEPVYVIALFAVFVTLKGSEVGCVVEVVGPVGQLLYAARAKAVEVRQPVLGYGRKLNGQVVVTAVVENKRYCVTQCHVAYRHRECRNGCVVLRHAFYEKCVVDYVVLIVEIVAPHQQSGYGVVTGAAFGLSENLP